MIYTDGIKHDLEWFEDFYINQSVTPENYTEETNKGLYTYVSSLLINAGMQKIRFEYRDDDGNLLKGETVPVLYYGQKGEPGEQGASYKGIGHDAIGTGICTPWVEGDTYINAADGYLYAYDSAERLWTKIPSYADSRYNQAINDMIALSNNTGYDAEFLNVINLWVRNLTAQTALINQLFAKELTLQGGGVIKSANYNGTINPETGEIISPGTEGFAIDYNGSGDFSNINIAGKIKATKGMQTGQYIGQYAYQILDRNKTKVLNLLSDGSTNNRFIANVEILFQLEDQIDDPNNYEYIMRCNSISVSMVHYNEDDYYSLRFYFPILYDKNGNVIATKNYLTFLYDMDNNFWNCSYHLYNGDQNNRFTFPSNIDFRHAVVTIYY